jgi:hypothetical protein
VPDGRTGFGPRSRTSTPACSSRVLAGSVQAALMPVPKGWDAAAALAARPAVAREGRLWRMHERCYPAEDPGGPVWCRDGTTARSTGSPSEKRFPLCTSPQDRRSAWGNLPAPHARAVAVPERFPLSKLLASVQRVVDCRDPNPLGLTSGDLSHVTDYRTTQALGTAADRRSLEGLLAGSRLRVASGRDPRLYVRRD